MKNKSCYILRWLNLKTQLQFELLAQCRIDLEEVGGFLKVY